MKGKYIILEKLDGTFRQDLPIGSKGVQGYCLEEPRVGYQFYLYNCVKDVEVMGAVIPCQEVAVAWTSVVKELDLEYNIIKTANSIYKFEIKNE